MDKLISFVHDFKYEILLAALIQHLFIGVFLDDLDFYTKVIWPINIFIVGMASVGIFVRKGRWKRIIRNFLFIVVFAFPLSLPFFSRVDYFMLSLNISYVLFFSYIFREVILFLVRPSYINVDIISAAACGYFLLLEISVFLMQVFFYENPASLNGVDTSSMAAVFMDLVYFNSVSLTSIGFGDITPAAYYTKLVTGFIGIVGQFYSVVLVGILIAKFSSKTIENGGSSQNP